MSPDKTIDILWYIGAPMHSRCMDIVYYDAVTTVELSRLLGDAGRPITGASVLLCRRVMLCTCSRLHCFINERIV